MSRSQKEKDKSLQEKHQAILSTLLRDEDNKYCVDCDAKGPRWASWNLGIFLCIRCAGIHRNLGVHISRVKSVNLDSWTSEQMQMVQEMGNSRARAVYEANLPDDYRRPQTDSALEIFIREKYEKKKYIAKEWIPPQPKTSSNLVAEERKEKKKPKPKASAQLQLNSTSTSRPRSNMSANSPGAPRAPRQSPAEKKTSASVDLLGLDTPSQGTASPPNTGNTTDLFGDFLSAAPAATSPVRQTEQTAVEDNTSLFTDMSAEAEKPKSTKDSIMALYGSGPASQSQQMYGIPGGMYMPQQQPQQQAQYAMMQNGAMAQPNNMMQQNNLMQQNAMPPQNNMMANNMGMMQQQSQQGMMNQNMAMQGGANMQMMGGQPNMYNQAQQQHLSQIQQQMASMKINSPGMGMGVGMQQQAQSVGAGGMGWGAQQAGHTLSNTLWQ